MIRILSLVLAGLSVLGGLPVPAYAQAAYSAAGSGAAEKLVAAFPEIKGQILSILPDGRVLLDLTAKDGAYAGLELEAFRPGDEFRHPITGEVLGRLQITAGTLRVTEVEEKFSVASLVTAAQDQPLRAGDGVRVTSARILLGLAKAGSSAASDAETRAATRDLEVALARTGRFEVVDERRMRSTLLKANLPADLPFTDPQALEVLRRELRLNALALPRISPLENRTLLDVEVVSALSGKAIVLASVEVPGTAVAAAAKPAPAAPPPPAQPPVPGERPTPAWIGPPGAPRPEGFRVTPSAGIPGARLVLGPDFERPGVGLSVADVDGDGQPDVVIATRETIHVYKVEGNLFREIWNSGQSGLSLRNNILAVDAADVNKNGRAEIFVTNYYGKALNSYVLEMEGREMRLLWRDAPLYFRVFPDPGDGKPAALYAQSAGLARAFEGPVRRYVWRGGEYVAGEAIELPRGVGIFGMVRGLLFGTSQQQVAWIDGSNRLKVADAGGQVRYISSERFGGSEVWFEYAPVMRATNPEAAPDTTIAETRLQLRDVSGDGRHELLVVRNRPSAGYIFENVRYYDRGKLLALDWSGASFRVLWETEDVEGYIADFGFLNAKDAPGGDLYLLVNRTLGATPEMGRGSLLLYRGAGGQG